MSNVKFEILWITIQSSCHVGIFHKKISAYCIQLIFDWFKNSVLAYLVEFKLYYSSCLLIWSPIILCWIIFLVLASPRSCQIGKWPMECWMEKEIWLMSSFAFYDRMIMVWPKVITISSAYCKAKTRRNRNFLEDVLALMIENKVVIKKLKINVKTILLSFYTA